MEEAKQQVVISNEGEVKQFNPAKTTGETVQVIYEAAKNYTTVGKAVCENVEDMVKKTGVIERTGLDVHIPAGLDAIDAQLNKIGLPTYVDSITEKLLACQKHFLGNLQLPEEYYEKIKNALSQLEESIQKVKNGLQSTIIDNTPKTPNTEVLKQLLEQAIAKSKELVTAVLSIPGKDVFQSLPTSVSGAVEYIKSTPAMFQKDLEQVKEKQEVQMVISHLNSLVDSVKQVYGQAISTVSSTTTTPTTTTTTTTFTESTKEFKCDITICTSCFSFTCSRSF
jgi:hypothetical protein